MLGISYRKDKEPLFGGVKEVVSRMKEMKRNSEKIAKG